MSFPRLQSGFTLIEMLLSLALFSILATGIYSFAWNIADLNAKGESARSLSIESRVALARLSYLIRNADGISSVSSDRLELEKPGGSGTVDIFLQGGSIVIDDGTSEEELLGSDVRATSLEFEDRRAGNGLSETVGFSFAVEGNDAALGSSFYSRMMLRSSATVRSFPSL